MSSVGRVQRSGLYLVTLHNIEPISANAHDPRMADTAVRVDLRHAKIGKAANFTAREKNYHKTFGVENVNFRPLVLVERQLMLEAERCVLLELARFRIAGPAGRKTEWLVGINADEIEHRVLHALRSRGVKHSFVAKDVKGQSSLPSRLASTVGPAMKTMLKTGIKAMQRSKVSETNAAGKTVRCMQELAGLEFPTELFPKLHHLGASFNAHQDFCRMKIQENKDFAPGPKGNTNRDVLLRLEDVLGHAGGSKHTRAEWKKIIEEARPPLPQKIRKCKEGELT